jgi:hypothetical protein
MTTILLQAVALERIIMRASDQHRRNRLEEPIFPNLLTNYPGILPAARSGTVQRGRLPISSIELQIAYKLRLAKAAGTTDSKDFEDALHLYLTFEDQFNLEQLKSYIKQLGVKEYYHSRSQRKSRSPLTVPVVLASASSNCT